MLERAIDGENDRLRSVSDSIANTNSRNCYNSDKVAEVSYASTLALQERFHRILLTCILQLSKAKTASSRNSAIAPSCSSSRPFAQRYTHHVAVERALILRLQRSTTLALVPWLVPKTSSQAQIIHQRCVAVLKMPSMLVSCTNRFCLFCELKPRS